MEITHLTVSVCTPTTIKQFTHFEKYQCGRRENSTKTCKEQMLCQFQPNQDKQHSFFEVSHTKYKIATLHHEQQ
jgi:hypothetical protein